jgi:hypothetical protein
MLSPTARHGHRQWPMPECRGPAPAAGREVGLLQLAPYLGGLLITPLQVSVHVLGMPQRPRQHGVDVGELERIEGADDILAYQFIQMVSCFLAFARPPAA